ncbi:hypothetical protein MKX03_037760, partial [Papaver bracteatum]
MGGYENQEIAHKLFDEIPPPRFDFSLNYEEGEIAHKVFDEMSPPKYDIYFSYEENGIEGELPIYQEGMNVDQIFNYFTILEQVLSSNIQEVKEHKSLYPTIIKVLDDGEVKYF